MTTILVTGGRDYRHKEHVFRTLDMFHRQIPISLVVEGGASGADEAAREWAIRRNVPYVEVVADWQTHGKSAGPIRNKAMLDNHKPAYVVAFPGGRGTANMCKLAREARVTVYSC